MQTQTQLRVLIREESWEEGNYIIIILEGSVEKRRGIQIRAKSSCQSESIHF